MFKSSFKLSAIFCLAILAACSSDGTPGGSNASNGAGTSASGGSAGTGTGGGSAGAGAGTGTGTGGSSSAGDGAGAGAGAGGGAGTGADPAPVALSKINNFQATRQGLDKINLSWDAVKDATVYKIYYANAAFKAGAADSEENKALAGYKSATANSNSYALTSDSNQAYFFKIQATNAAGSNSPYADANSPALAALATPTNLKAERIGFDKVKLDWDKVSAANKYKISTAQAPFKTWQEHSSNSNTLTLQKLAHGDYAFKVQALNDKNNPSAASSQHEFSVEVVAGTGLDNTCFQQFAKKDKNGSEIFFSETVDCGAKSDPAKPVWPGQDGKPYEGARKMPARSFSKEGDCLRDNVTGLLWEQKTNDSGLHDYEYKYYFYLPKTDSMAADVGYKGDNTTCSLTECNSLAYVNKVNADKYCGRSNWRLPTAKELLSLANISNSLTVQKNEEFTNLIEPSFAFYNEKNRDGVHLHGYMTSSLFYSTEPFKSFLYAVNFRAEPAARESALGLLVRLPLDFPAKVRLVSDNKQ